MRVRESVPNFSEGRDRATIDALADALSSHARLLDVHADPDHNRSVFTIVGDADGLVDARRPLVAFNVNLRGSIDAAREIASAVRERDGGFPGVRALGLDLPRAGLGQVSMNVEDLEAAELHEIVAKVEAEARARDAEVIRSELVGLMPASAAAAAAGAALRIEGFDPSRVLELRILER